MLMATKTGGARGQRGNQRVSEESVRRSLTYDQVTPAGSNAGRVSRLALFEKNRY